MTIRNFINRVLGRRDYKFEPGDGTAHGDWRVGDLAVCIDDRWSDLRTGLPSETPPIYGEVYRVTGVEFWEGYHLLHLSGFHPDVWQTAKSFRKAVLDKDEACEPEFVTLLKRSKRKVSA